MKKNKLVIFILLSFILLNLYTIVKAYKKINYQDKFIRLHVVANSNSIADQIEKLKISEEINNYINSLNISKNSTKKEILEILNNNSEKIISLVDKNTNYNTTLKIGKIYYDLKESLTYDMPKGTYDSIQIILGKGEGKNIWSFIFPDKSEIKKLENFETILPGISKLYNNNLFEKDITYSVKLVEVLKEYF